MKWEIKGLDRQSGKADTIIIDADSERDAVMQAAGVGLVVEKVIKHEPRAMPPVKEKSPSDGLGCLTIGFGWLLGTFAFFAVIGGFGAAVIGPDQWHTDNAIGASANSLQRIIGALWMIVGFLAAIASMACGIYVELRRSWNRSDK